ncbi:hypothetical protein [Yokenella regensburgei]|uniref:hypothetical protein n=1 Tax=Yokenella regensburgei TaxID=158877 RepID=UPI0013758726|nr:hypothetical protein [Yokenella regensburgei]KAF1366324.1 hypothetical protein FHR25_005208 [Yokenella regensburgei]
MKLVWKENPRGRFFRNLQFSEREALLHVFSSGRKPGRADVIVADAILAEMGKRQLLIECDCVEKCADINGPFNSVVTRESGKHIRHLTTSAPHDEQCPLHRIKRTQDVEEGGRGEEINPLNPVGGNDWLPDRRDETKVNPTGEPGADPRLRRTALKPVPALGRKLLTLLQVAGLNQRELVPHYQSPGTAGAITSIKDVLKNNAMNNGVVLSEVFSCAPWLSVGQIAVMMSKLENNPSIAASNKEACICIIGLTKSLTTESVTFKIKDKEFTHRPAARIKINGESTYNAGSRAPYWAIIEYRRDKKGLAYCHSGYAHSAYSMEDPVPVDSNRERTTLDTIIDASKYTGTKASSPAAISLTKPLFSMKSLKDDIEEPIHPDFILKVIPANEMCVTTLIIETMGSDAEEYISRKARTHSWMRQEGTLLTDPPGWPHHSDTSFNQLLLSHLFKVGKQ